MGWIPSCVTFIIICATLVGPGLTTDPVYTPPSLSDTAGNTADSSSTVTWVTLPTGSSYKSSNVALVSSSMKPFYDLTRSFINTIFPQDFPPTVLEKLLDGDTSYVVSNYSEYLSFFIGYGICVAIGVLFLLVFPLVACCFCCCRCCGNCGGKRLQDPDDAKDSCRRHTYSVILLLLLAIISAGMATVYVNNDLTSDAVTSIPDNVVANIDDMGIYVNNTVTQANHIARTNFDFLKSALHRDLDNVAYLVGLPIRTDIETNTGLPATITSAKTLPPQLTAAKSAFDDVKTKKADLEAKLSLLETALTDSKNNVDTALATCAGACTGTQPDTNSLSVGVDATNFPDISSQDASMTSAGTEADMNTTINDAETELNDIPTTVETDSASTVSSLKTDINSLSDDIDPMVNSITDLQNVVYGNSATLNLEDTKDTVREYGDTAKQYDQYRWYGGLGLACVVLLVVVLAVLGLLFGVFGHRDVAPEERGCLSNSGGNLLMASAAFILIFSTLLMLLTFLTFLLGAPLERFICQPLAQDSLSTLETLIDGTYNTHEAGQGKYYFGKLLANNDTIAITFTGLLRDCRDGKSAYNAFHLDTRFDLNSLLEYNTTFDVDTEINNINVNLSSVDLYPATLETQLNDLKDAINVDFSTFYTELGNAPVGTDLGAFATVLDNYAAIIAHAPTQTVLNDEANALRAINTTELAAVEAAITALNTSVAAMETAVSAMPALITNIQTGLSAAETYIQGTAPTTVTTELRTFANRLLAIADSYVSYTRTSVTTNMGLCTPLWNLYDSLLVNTFCYNVVDVLNGFWFSLGWCVFFFMPSLIFSVKLAKHFRRMTYSDHLDDVKDRRYPDHPDVEHYREPVGGDTNGKPAFKLRKNKVAHSDDW